MKKIFFFFMIFSVSQIFAETVKENQGIIYILTNRAMNIDGIPLIKIGFTEQNLKDRINQLSTTGVPVKFEEYYSIKINNYKKIETNIHNVFKEYRVNKNREFFQMDPEYAKMILIGLQLAEGQRVAAEENISKK